MKGTPVLRGIAVLIAAAGAIDPVWTREMPVDPPIAIRVLDTPTLGLPANDETRRARAIRVAESVRAQLGGGAVVEWVAAGAHSACPAFGTCVLVTDQGLDRPVSSGARVAGAIDVSTPLAPNIVLADVESPARVSLHGSARLRVHLRGHAISGASRVEVRAGGVLVGSAEHTWAVAEGISDVPLDVNWVPLEGGPQRLEIAVVGPEGERSTLDNVADVVVDVSAEPWPVLIDEPQATWTGTFVRRALEADVRFALRSRTQLAPGLMVSRGGLRSLSPESLDQARLVIVTSPDALSVSDVERLERFVEIRGGSLVVLPDRRPAGPALRLMPTITGERQVTAPEAVGELRASDIVTFRADTGVQVIETLGSQPVIVARAMGRGRVVVSGALDAWRYREGGRFARYWTSLMADAASVAPPAMDVMVTPAVASPHQSVQVVVSRHAMMPVASELTATATLDCGDAREPIRLWPSAQAGAFSGVMIAPAEGACVIEATIAGRDTAQSTGRLLVAPGVRPSARARARLADAMAAHGAPIVPVGREDELAARVRELLPSGHVPRETHPMRSPWWLIPFAGCLSLEWWARRRRGGR